MTEEDWLEDDKEIRPRIGSDIAEEVIEDKNKSFEKNLMEKLGLDE